MAVAGAVSGEPLVHWCTQQLRKTFGLDVSEEIIQYVLSIESAEEIREYVTDLLQGNEGKKGQFIEELITKWQKNDQELISDPLQQCFKKDEILDGQKSGDHLKRGRKKGRNRQEVPAFTEPDTTAEVKTPFDLAKAQENSNSVKKKTKFVNLYTREGQDRLAVLLPGRHPCDCLGQKHKLINNCLICGRIVCEQEGSGPCLFCGTLISGVENSGKVDISTKDLLPHQELRIKSGLEKAIKHKDKLLEFDRTSIRRTQVIDDESDYFASDSNQWLSKLERETLQKREEELRELRHASRLSKKVTIDFAGRKILEEENSLAEYHSRLDETIQAIANGTLNQPLTKLDRSSEEPLGVLVNPNMYQSPPQWVDHTGAASQKKAFRSSGLGLEFNSLQHQLRIQDQEFQEGFDGGWCLSIHQPWASLLVRGIKRVEGRSWYTPHRGRLWIAATAKKPSPQEVSELQATYRLLRGKDVEFPNDYPSGCLLGCVDLIDCLSQKQFKEQFPDISQESDSPFVFICKNPQEMVVKFPIKGNPKIWKLDSKIHQGAKKGLMKQNKAV
ncbi:PREDICTED: activating signal cointegrator 1 [Colobus angolensis palliatus]|uniref:activating signal cointegrator 1 n=1 Tax=Colobus angolensis palliatus TaxID=336983 RepID=UPI0005F4D34E|nr:PREDICTED: activating signal cointegrator 1 [Colobus angolensis palliatus]